MFLSGNIWLFALFYAMIEAGFISGLYLSLVQSLTAYFIPAPVFWLQLQIT